MREGGKGGRKRGRKRNEGREIPLYITYNFPSLVKGNLDFHGLKEDRRHVKCKKKQEAKIL